MKVSQYRLLLVDDNIRSLKLLQAIYEAEGYEVVTASDGKEAIEILLKSKVHLIVTDVLMPNVDGYYLCYKVRSNEQLKDIPIIIYTATYTSQSEEKIAKEMGADLFIRKPAALQVLVSAVRDTLANPKKHEEFSRDAESFEIMHQYSSELINKLELRNTELEQATDHLQLTLRRFRQAEQIAHVGHWEVNLRTNKVVWSDETFCILGIKPGSVEPSEELLLRYLHPEDRERAIAVRKQSTKMFTPFSFYHRVVQQNGNIRNVFSVARYEFDNADRPLYLYGVSLDITLLVEKEQKLLQANKELETFIYKAYHDLRSPIVTTLGMVNLAKAEITDPKALEYFNTIRDVTIKQNNMLLTLVKVMSARSRDQVVESFSMIAFLEEILNSLESVEGFKKIKFKVNNQVTSPISNDRALLSDILYRLIENAIQYYNIDCPVPEVSLTVRNDAEYLYMEVADNGIGMSEIVKEKVFDMFYRGTHLSKGFGLGLYLVKNAVERLKGTIELVSQEGKGSTFKLKIPI